MSDKPVHMDTGLFRLFWMSFFARHSKYMKGLVCDVSRPESESNTVNSATQDIDAHYTYKLVRFQVWYDMTTNTEYPPYMCPDVTKKEYFVEYRLLSQ